MNDLNAELAAARNDPSSDAALRESNAAFLRAHDPAAFARSVERRARTGAVKRASFVLAPALACALLVVVVTRDPPAPTLTDAAGEIRIKGNGPLLLASLVKPEGPARIDDGTRARAGDVVQLRVDHVAADAQVVVVSIDGRGNVTLHHPLRPGAALGPQGLVPQSFELDDAPAFERFIAVIATVGDDVRVDDVVAAARSIAGGTQATTTPLPLPSSMLQRSIVVVKDTQ